MSVQTVSLPKDPKNPKEIPEPKESDTPSDINLPELDENGKPTRKAIENHKQAHAIAKRLYDRAKDGRIKVAAVVAAKYGGEQPFNPVSLKKTGQSWRNNFTTHFLASIVDRAKPQMVDPIKGAIFLTYSSLPPNRDNADNKTNKFRTRITKLIRKWSGWVNFVDIICQEDYLNGNAAPTFIDDDWRPKAWRFDEAFLPDGVGQHAKQTPFIVIRQPILLHELIKKIDDEESAKDAGYDIKGCIAAINEAQGMRANSDESPMEKVDKWRENSSLSNTYDGEEVKVVWLYHVIVQEWKGGTALWTVAEKGEHPIRYVEDFTEDMEEVTTLFTLQTGNEKFYGSKGAGRMLANLHIAIERGRNLANDQIYLSGLPILQSGDADMNSIQPVVRHPFIIVPKSCTVQKEQVAFDPAAFEFMDNRLVQVAESIAGAFIPPNVQQAGGSTTRIADAQKAARELAVRNGVLGRFFQQFGELIGSMQKKICKPENLKEAMRLYKEETEKKEAGIRVIASKVYKWLKQVMGTKEKREGPLDPDPKRIQEMKTSSVADPEAVSCLVDLLRDGLTPQDIIELALCPAGNDVEDQNEDEQNKVLGFINTKQQMPSPYLNQAEMAKIEAEAVLGEEGAKRILVPDAEDPNVKAVAERQQVIEMAMMTSGEDMPVAITDNHKIHRETMLPKMGPLFAQFEKAPSQAMLDPLKFILNHYVMHIQMDMQMMPDDKKQQLEPLQNLEKVINDGEEQLMKLAEQAQAAGVPGGPDALPPQIPGGAAPIQAGADGQGMSHSETELEKDKAAAEIVLRKGDQAIEHRKLDIKEKELEQKDQHQTLSTVTKMGLDVTQKMAEANKEGRADAEKDLMQEAGVSSDAPKP